MATVKREITVAKELIELGDGIVKFLQELKTALDDGFQPGEDLAVFLSAVIGDLVPALKGADKIGSELDDPQTFVNAVYVGFSPIAFMFVGSNDETVTE